LALAVAVVVSAESLVIFFLMASILNKLNFKILGKLVVKESKRNNILSFQIKSDICEKYFRNKIKVKKQLSEN